MAKDTGKRISRKMFSRISVVFILFGIAAGAIIIRLGYIQIKNYDYYRTKALDQMTVETEVSADRGTIYDRNGSVLATNATNYFVCISPHDIIEYIEPAKAETVTDAESGATVSKFGGVPVNEFIAEKLSEILGVDEDEVLEKAALVGRHYEVIKKEVKEEDAQKIRELIEEYGLTRQIFLRANTYREYPYGNLASQTVGFVNTEGNGALGIESYYNNLLTGTKGKYIVAQDAHSKDMPFEYESFIDPENGYSIETTLDVYLQYELENQLKATYEENLPGERVTGIVMDVNDGSILAMATYPTFDLNDPYGLDAESKAKLEEYAKEFPEGTEEYTKKRNELLYRMWSNKAIGVLYEPGSTFKAITSSMGFEEKVINENTAFYCSGALKIDGYPKPISCHLHSGHGAVSFATGLQQSCNPVFMKVGEALGTTTFYKYLNSFGYLEKTGIDLPAEAKGIVSSEAAFDHVSLAVYSFGQTFKTTPIQQIRAISAVANGGYLVTPHLLKTIKDSDGNIVAEYESETLRQVISTESASRVTKILEEGVSGDGGAKNAYVKGYKVAAKTGTSEKKDKKDENGEYSYRVGSTVAYAPAYDPEIAVLIVVDEPSQGVVYGSRVAAPYVSNFLSSALPYLGYEAQYTDKDLERVEATIPDLVGMSVEDAKADLKWRELDFEVVGGGDTVTGQLPPAAATVSKSDGRVIIYTGGETPKADVKVPDLVGKTAEAANRLLVNAGLNIDFEGAAGHQAGAVVVSQSVAAEAMVPAGTVVTIELRYTDTND